MLTLWLALGTGGNDGADIDGGDPAMPQVWPVAPTRSPLPILQVEVLDATPSPTVTLAPTPLPVVQEPAGDAPEWAIEIICAPEYQWPCEEALSVAWCESRFRADAINWWTGTPQEGDGVFGILQVALPLHADLLAQYGAWDDPVANVAAAYQLYTARDSTWSHWAWECRPY